MNIVEPIRDRKKIPQVKNQFNKNILTHKKLITRPRDTKKYHEIEGCRLRHYLVKPKIFTAWDVSVWEVCIRWTMKEWWSQRRKTWKDWSSTAWKNFVVFKGDWFFGFFLRGLLLFQQPETYIRQLIIYKQLNSRAILTITYNRDI